MQAVIERVMATEAEARQLVQTARAEAEQLVAGARVQARQLIDEARREARREADEILAAAEAEAVAEKQKRLAQAAKDVDAQVRLDEATMQAAVEAAVRCLCGGTTLAAPEDGRRLP